MTRILSGYNNAYQNLSQQGDVGEVEGKQIKALATSLRSSDTSSFINSAYLIDLSEEAKSLSQHAKDRISMNEIINNWRELRESL